MIIKCNKKVEGSLWGQYQLEMAPALWRPYETKWHS